MELNIEYYTKNKEVSINGNMSFRKQKESLEKILTGHEAIEKHDIKSENKNVYEIKIKYEKNIILESNTGSKELTYIILKQALELL